MSLQPITGSVCHINAEGLVLQQRGMLACMGLFIEAKLSHKSHAVFMYRDSGRAAS